MNYPHLFSLELLEKKDATRSDVYTYNTTMAYNENWERTKRYLFRNLLEDPGYRLSPVTEESVSDELVGRPCSPLPDLVIEPEPNRHDDPPEFYQGLEVRMRRLYKRLMEDRASSEETEGLINLEKDISDYNVDQHISHRGLLESYQATTNESDPEIFNTNNVLKEIQNMSKENKDKSTDDISPVIGLGRATIVSRTTEMEFTESNFDCAHFISTGNDKHEEPLSGKTVVVETESPVLVHKLQKTSSAEDFSGLTGNCILVDKAQDKNDSETMDDVEMTNENKKQDTIIDNTDADECVSDNSFELAMRKEAFERINKRKIFDHSSEEINDYKEYEEFIFVNQITNDDDDSDLDSFEIAMCRETFRRINRTKGFGQSSGELHSVTEDEEVNDYKEYEELIFVNQITSDDDDSDLDSFEIAMCRETFRRINRTKGFGQSSGELHSVTEDEEVEEMRGAPLTDPLQAFKRRSTASQESLLGTFAKPTVAEIHEDISIGDEGLHTSRKSPEARDDGCLSEDVNCRGGMSIDNEEHANVFPGPLKSQSGIGIEEDSESQNSPDSHNTDDISENKPTKSFRLDVRESSVGTEEATPSAPKDNVMSTLSVPTKRRQKFSSDILKKRKKY